MDKRPIGIFDSGIGGLTVYQEIRQQFPHEDIIYFGDTARVPYGPKSSRTVIAYSVQNARFLLQNGAKIIVIACNTSSAVALDHLHEILQVPVMGVIEPGARAAADRTKNGLIGVIGTSGTIKSEAYPKAIARIDPALQVFSQACPLLVPLVEEGWNSHSVTRTIITEYLEPLLKENIDTLVLGCTHYPILKPQIGEVLGDDINMVDSAQSLADELRKILPEPAVQGRGTEDFFVSDDEERFSLIASHILKREIKTLRKVTLGESWYLH
ncbi:MAG: glutamate racemase [Candidatus Cloacimonetes bacterium]|nr:glutamate racemase [Candidatus Cloacimonadota bacterium]